MTALVTEQEAKEHEDVAQLEALMGGSLGSEEIRRILRKYNGDVNRAADALLSGDFGKEPEEVPRIEVQAPRSTPPDTDVIDLTQDDEVDTAKFYAEQAQKVMFGPSNRQPDPNWQMTLVSDKPSQDTQQNDVSLDHAIQASLADFQNDDELEIYPMEESLREGQRPIALRPDSATIVYAALVVQALFAVPQIRQAVARLELPDVGGPPPQEEIPSSIWYLVELFTNLDRAVLSSIVDKDAVPSLDPSPWNGTADSLPKLTVEFLGKLSELIECRLSDHDIDVNGNRAPPNLFNFLHTEIEFREGQYNEDPRGPERTFCVPVEVGDGGPNDLISKLASKLSAYKNDSSSHDVIAEASELLMFQLEQAPKLPGYSTAFSPAFSSSTKSTPELFSFPRVFYLDRFMKNNIPVVNEKRHAVNEMLAGIEDLAKRKDFVLRNNGRDTIKDLTNTVYYYEHVAQSKGDFEREENLQKTKKRLQGILDVIAKGAQQIDQRVEELQALVSKAFDSPELQQHRYDLRAVLVHTGLPGRKQVYSYIQDAHGVWWKTLDCSVTEVSEETVLTDPTGLHLGAGPYLLIYSRHVSEEEMNVPINWPRIFSDSVDGANKTFLSQLPPELVSKVTAQKPTEQKTAASQLSSR